MGSTALKHDALFYGSDDEFTEPMTAFISEGLDSGDAAVVVATDRNNDLLKGALGPAATEVTFINADEWYQRPGKAIERYHRILNDLTASGAPLVRVIGQVKFGDSPAEQLSWTRYEAVLNQVFESAPAWIICPYDTQILPDHVLEHASRTHPQVWEQKTRRVSDRYVDPSLLLTEIPEPFARLRTVPILQLPISGELQTLRALVERTALWAGLPELKCQDLMLAVNEIVTNVIRYARGKGTVALWDARTSLICEVQDQGPGLSDPFAGYIPPPTDAIGGMGLWIARQLVDRVSIALDAEGTRVQLIIHK